MFVSYPAVFYKKSNEEGYTVLFPDLKDCVTSGKDVNEAFLMASDALCTYLYYFFIQGKKFPIASDICHVSVKPSAENRDYNYEGSFKSLVGANFDEYLKKSESKVVRKSLTIPSYLNEMGKSMNVNFSQILTDALKNEFDIDWESLLNK